MNKKMSIALSLTLGAILSVIFVAAATILGELYTPFKGWLADTFSHHWVGKGVLSLVVFFGTSFLSLPLISNKQNHARLGKFIQALFFISMFAAASILLFYLYEYSIAH